MTLEVEVYLSQLNNGTFVGHFGRKMIRSKPSLVKTSCPMKDFHNMTSITLLHCSTLPEDWHLLFSGQSRTLPRRLSLSCQQTSLCNGWDHLLLKVLDHIKKIISDSSYPWHPQPCLLHVLDNLNLVFFMFLKTSTSPPKKISKESKLSGARYNERCAAVTRRSSDIEGSVFPIRQVTS